MPQDLSRASGGAGESRVVTSAVVTDTADFIIAIDGPSGAGKGTIARAVASRLGYRHVDTGAMYRALAWKAVHERLDLTDEDAVAALAERARFEIGDGVVRVDGHDVAAAIRTAEMDQAAAAVARQPRVRAILVARQRALGATGGVVMEGRDIGTAVFPDAPLKIYLDASPEERARRRANDPAHSAGRGAAAIQDVADRAADPRSQRSHPRSLAAAAGARRHRDRHDRSRDRRGGAAGALPGAAAPRNEPPARVVRATSHVTRRTLHVARRTSHVSKESHL
jgi:CMP/dCMP kinase